jgi:hypothetical protein
VSNVRGARGTAVTLSASLRRTLDNAPLNGKTLTFKVDGVTVGTGVTGSNGVASLSYLIPPSMSVGAHAITVSYAGDSIYGASSGTGTLTAD